MAIIGVPSVIGVSLFEDVVFAIADALGLLTGFAASPWGIFQNGVSVVEADSVVSVGYRNDYSIADFQVEEGGFQSYDKVNNPFNNRVRFASGGSQANRQALIDSIEAIAGTLELYDVVTPEKVYTSVNVQGYDLNRTSNNGVGLIQVDVKLVEVRVTATAQFSNTKTPTAAAQENNGTVQPVTPTSTNGGGALQRIVIDGSTIH